MTQTAQILLGTAKGIFILESDRNRRDWSIRGPYCGMQPINHVIRDEVSGTLFAAGGSAWEGATVWRSKDNGHHWTRHDEGLILDDGEKIQSVWSVAGQGGKIFAGVQPAALFQSSDQGESWQQVKSLTDHPSRQDWGPGGAGMILHHIEPHPADRNQLWVGISVAGVFHTQDGGETWSARNTGTRQDYAPEVHRYPEWGQCVHSIAVSRSNPDRLYQQNHCGMYRSDDGARTWRSIEEGLPSSFGFPSAVHHGKPDQAYLIPLNGDSDGRFFPDAGMAVWRTRDGGKSWQDLRNGLPQKNAFSCVLRQAMAADRFEPLGIFAGTNSGTLFASIDEGDSWWPIFEHLPTIFSVETSVEF